jgi:type I restriction enzyme S subunit
MNQNHYPTEWQKVPLAYIANWGSGGTPSRKNPEYYDGNIPWIKTGDLGPRVILAASEYITDLGVQKSSAKSFPKGSVAMAMYGATIGKVSILGIDTTTNQACAVGQPIAGVTDSSFLYYLLRNEKNAFIAKGKGGAQPNISQTLIKEHPVALPPLAEQKAIADKLDTLLAQVENTKAHLECVPKILKRFRQSVLAAAVSGQLASNSEPNDKRRPSVQLVNLCISAFDGPFGSKLKSSDYTDSGVGVVRLENIKHLSFDRTKKTFVSEKKYRELERNKLEKDDVLFSSFVDEEVRACLFPFETRRFINKADCFCLRINDEKAIPKFVLYMLTSRFAYTQIKEHVQGVTRPRVNLRILKSLEFPMPSIKEQTEIVRQVDRLFVHADRIEQQVNDALFHVNNLTQSILAKAFRGELTEQWRKDNPELISGENSAAALLERIKVERAAMKPTSAARKRKTSA